MTVAPSNQVASHCSSDCRQWAENTLHSLRSCQGGGNKMMAWFWPTKVNTKNTVRIIKPRAFRIAAIFPKQTFPGSDVFQHNGNHLFVCTSKVEQCIVGIPVRTSSVRQTFCISLLFSICAVVYAGTLVLSPCLAVLHFSAFLDV